MVDVTACHVAVLASLLLSCLLLPLLTLLSPFRPLGSALARMVDVTACHVAVLASLLLSCLLLPLLLVLVSPFSFQTLLPRR